MLRIVDPYASYCFAARREAHPGGKIHPEVAPGQLIKMVGRWIVLAVVLQAWQITVHVRPLIFHAEREGLHEFTHHCCRIFLALNRRIGLNFQSSIGILLYNGSFNAMASSLAPFQGIPGLFPHWV